ncbi:MAG: hypothetical protein RMX68_013820 [Aulosira sp. ZfuVER01]|nr:hypothetical protein [Aulosira sp. DedVER01a]MDZ8053469.1 hypothetical protein [Aulosira sp. ZfuCHP01]
MPGNPSTGLAHRFASTSRQSRRQSPQVGKPAHGAVSPTHWLLKSGEPFRQLLTALPHHATPFG